MAGGVGADQLVRVIGSDRAPVDNLGGDRDFGDQRFKGLFEARVGVAPVGKCPDDLVSGGDTERVEELVERLEIVALSGRQRRRDLYPEAPVQGTPDPGDGALPRSFG